ncbi:YqaJ viral recombinase family protein [Staphylococcus chromogenes]|nr:YqaJ viral recombinase family protein [Staphylococcus chromogenes]
MKIIETNSRDEWLEARKGYLTATDIATLMTGGPAAWARIKDSKSDQPTRDLMQVKAIAHGHNREPEIAEYITMFEDSRLQANDRLCVSDADSRLAATPDMIAVVDGQCVAIGEIKTTKHGWEPDQIPEKYWVQVQTQLFVTGAQHCVFAWEVHENYLPGDIQTVIITPDLEYYQQIAGVVQRFFDPEHTVDPWEALLDEYLVWSKEVSDAAEALADVKKRMEEFAGDKDVTYKSEQGSITYKQGNQNVLREDKLLAEHPELAKKYFKFDAAAFKKSEKDLAKQYTVTRKAKSRTLRVTPRKDAA